MIKWQLIKYIIFGGVPDPVTMQRMTRTAGQLAIKLQIYERVGMDICNVFRNFGLSLADAEDSLRSYSKAIKPYQSLFRCKWNVLTGLVIK